MFIDLSNVQSNNDRLTALMFVIKQDQNSLESMVYGQYVQRDSYGWTIEKCAFIPQIVGSNPGRGLSIFRGYKWYPMWDSNKKLIQGLCSVCSHTRSIRIVCRICCIGNHIIMCRRTYGTDDHSKLYYVDYRCQLSLAHIYECFHHTDSGIKF